MRCNTHNSRKAALSISTNAIVVLIVAVIMLSLIVGLVTQAFGAVEDRFLGEIEQEPDAPGTSNAQPITINKDSVRAEADELIGFKVRIRNLNETAADDDIRPILECPTANIVIDRAFEEQVLAKQIDFTEEESYTYISQISGAASQGTYLCQMQAINVTGIAADLTYDDFMNASDVRRINKTFSLGNIRPTEIEILIT